MALPDVSDREVGLVANMLGRRRSGGTASPSPPERGPFSSSGLSPLQTGSCALYLLLAIAPTRLIELRQLLLSRYTFPKTYSVYSLLLLHDWGLCPGLGCLSGQFGCVGKHPNLGWFQTASVVLCHSHRQRQEG